MTLRPALCAAVLLAVPACGPAPSGKAAQAAAERRPDQIIENFTIDSFAKGRKEWVLRAPRADLFDKEHRIDIQKPFVQFYENDKPSSTLEAGHGEIHTADRNLRAWEEVVMISTDGSKLMSDWMDYDAAKDRIVSTAPVTIEQRGSVIHGIGWEATPDLSEVFIKQQRVEIPQKDRPKKKKKR